MSGIGPVRQDMFGDFWMFGSTHQDSKIESSLHTYMLYRVNRISEKTFTAMMNYDAQQIVNH